MDDETKRYVLDLEGRLAALSGVVAALAWTLRERGVLDADMERQLYRGVSDAVSTLPPQVEAAADRLILALQSSARIGQFSRSE